MKKAITIYIEGKVFYFDEDAFARFDTYINRIEDKFSQTEGGTEIIRDIKVRFVELFLEKIKSPEGVISIEILNNAISIMGEIEDFEAEADQQFKNEKAVPNESAAFSKRDLCRQLENKIVGGVCAGMATFFNVELNIVRILAIVIGIVTFPIGIIVYLILSVTLPIDTTGAYKQQWFGNINITRDKRFVNWFNQLQPVEKLIMIIAVVVVGVVILARFAGFLFHFKFFPFSY